MENDKIREALLINKEITSDRLSDKIIQKRNKSLSQLVPGKEEPKPLYKTPDISKLFPELKLKNINKENNNKKINFSISSTTKNKQVDMLVEEDALNNITSSKNKNIYNSITTRKAKKLPHNVSLKENFEIKAITNRSRNTSRSGKVVGGGSKKGIVGISTSTPIHEKDGSKEPKTNSNSAQMTGPATASVSTSTMINQVHNNYINLNQLKVKRTYIAEPMLGRQEQKINDNYNYFLPNDTTGNMYLNNLKIIIQKKKEKPKQPSLNTFDLNRRFIIQTNNNEEGAKQTTNMIEKPSRNPIKRNFNSIDLGMDIGLQEHLNQESQGNHVNHVNNNNYNHNTNNINQVNKMLVFKNNINLSQKKPSATLRAVKSLNNLNTLNPTQIKNLKLSHQCSPTTANGKKKINFNKCLSIDTVDLTSLPKISSTIKANEMREIKLEKKGKKSENKEYREIIKSSEFFPKKKIKESLKTIEVSESSYEISYNKILKLNQNKIGKYTSEMNDKNQKSLNTQNKPNKKINTTNLDNRKINFQSLNTEKKHQNYHLSPLRIFKKNKL